MRDFSQGRTHNHYRSLHFGCIFVVTWLRAQAVPLDHSLEFEGLCWVYLVLRKLIAMSRWWLRVLGNFLISYYWITWSRQGVYFLRFQFQTNARELLHISSQHKSAQVNSTILNYYSLVSCPEYYQRSLRSRVALQAKRVELFPHTGLTVLQRLVSRRCSCPNTILSSRIRVLFQLPGPRGSRNSLEFGEDGLEAVSSRGWSSSSRICLSVKAGVLVHFLINI